MVKIPLVSGILDAFREKAKYFGDLCASIDITGKYGGAMELRNGILEGEKTWRDLSEVIDIPCDIRPYYGDMDNPVDPASTEGTIALGLLNNKIRVMEETHNRFWGPDDNNAPPGW